MVGHQRIRNIRGTAGRDCACGSWINHFRNHTTGTHPLLCPVKGCWNAAKLGAHVYLPDLDGGTNWPWQERDCPLPPTRRRKTHVVLVSSTGTDAARAK